MRKPSTLGALIGYFTPSHVINQRLSLKFLSAPEDGRKKRPKLVEIIAVTNKHTAKLHHVGSLYIQGGARNVIQFYRPIKIVTS